MKKLRLCLSLFLALLAQPAWQSAAFAQDLETETARAGVLFDGAGAYAGTAAAAGASAEGKAQLLAALKTRVTIDDRGVPAEGAALNSMLSRILDTPTGRELAVKFLQENATATVSFDTIPDTKVFYLNGKKTFWASGGNAHARNNPPLVHMNSAFMEAKQEEAPGIMAHELFGHVLEGKRADRYGVADVYNYNQNEEANASLAGWTVSAELGNKIVDNYAWVYMENPEKYHKQLKSNMASYNRMLSAEEMKDPLPVYQARLVEADKLLLRLPLRKDNYTGWLKVVNHLVALHKMIEDSFKSIKEDIQASLDSIPGAEVRINNIKNYLKELIAHCAGQYGEGWMARLEESSGNAYFAEQEKVLEERRKVLAGLMLGKTQEGERPPPVAGQVTWPQLEELWKQEQNSACGWRP
jgi:hypothetical protein